ncbi:outer membrane beta-barrel protein [Thalassomonas sp. M1454]|uniref:outer membrane beta-barrel protein n=1 Tax=Thalassomonas sp. M1454 TaxID=2594477 RepID=UPI00117FD84F|nr:outer membrane beta-barrel protein [Thalassomonas sp. M1454]TRX53917.1 outer membrane beta-barrel protein [Thalassomonas sp. M1454]
MKKSLIIPVLALSFSQPLFAADNADDGAWQLTVFAGQRTSTTLEDDKDDDDVSIDETVTEVDFLNDTSAGLILGWEYDNNGRYGELLFSHSATEFEFDNDVELDDMDVSVTYLHFGGSVPVSSGKVPIYVSAGIGIAHLAPGDDSLDTETRPSANLGVGARFNFNENFALRLDARGYGTFFDSDGYIFCSGDTCRIRTSSNVWFQADFTAGLTYTF